MSYAQGFQIALCNEMMESDREVEYHLGDIYLGWKLFR